MLNLYFQKKTGDSLNIFILPNQMVFACSIIGFIYGIRHLVKGKKAIFPKMVTGAIGCIALGRLYQLVRLATGGKIEGEFQLGILGVIGGLMFFFSANFGLMDSIADDGALKLKKYRIIAFSAPVLSLTIYLLFVFFTDTIMPFKLLAGIATLFIMPTSYFNLKHLLLPDVENGVIRCLRRYNLLVLIFCFLTECEMIALINRFVVFEWVNSVIMGLVLLWILPSVKKGMDKWTS